ncbi:tRNA (guanosine-2'-O-)-methyltransferase [Desulfobaculum xiamenense]|uniref:tRNA (guanosine(18)-2'-O)-methyltransferase n=1 Tax=Desulfobaculum xiamenense TaxID=995050 RepID=A0A846QPF8_9BACT|nr:TrmH family RNA methyltransferase [Desulfobaculum xiamenense]NJB67104.1 tRNA (guanosine-2'-O-)-methyltransferase [Desulfobaculum xiamenense]
MRKFAQCRTPERRDRMRSVLERRQNDLSLILANIWDPHNVSAILRSCDAFGVPRVHLYYTDTAFPNIGRKASGSAKKWVECQRHTNAEALIGGLRAEGYQILSTGFSETARPLMDCDLTLPTVIMLGNEHRGVDAELDRLAADQVYIPMQGMVQSLNVSVAAAVTLYEAYRQRMAKGMYDQPTYDSETLDKMVDEWCTR